MKPIKLIKLDTSINFLSKTKPFVSLSLIFIIASTFLLFSRGLNFGIDCFGESAPGKEVAETLGLTPHKIAKSIEKHLHTS